jgi:diguanylate cyclase (GGDEF)-like protein
MSNKVVAYENKKNILIINSYHKGYKWNDDIMSGIESIINTSILDTNVDIEYMDTLRTSGQEYEDEIYKIYKYKYSGKKLDAVICCDDTAYNFVLKYENNIFPNVPIVFCGVNYVDSSKINGNKMITGIVENYDLEANLDLILKIHPSTKNIYVINDNTITGQSINKKLYDVIPKYQSRLNFINLKDYMQSEILRILNKPLENSVILFLIFFQDSKGNKFNYDESSKNISKNTSIPMYGAWEFSLGNGIIGGMLTSGYFQGKTAAEITLRILNGESPSNIPILDNNTNSYMFDYSEMKRFGVEQSQLPSQSTIINKPSNGKKQVLVLNSYDSNMKWTGDIVNGIKTVLDDKKYELYIDYMDIKKNYTDEYTEKIEDLLKYKYKDKQFDLIITSDNDAYDFMKRYHNKLFSSIPLVFCGLNYYSENDISNINSTGVTENIDTKKTLELALVQNPNTKHVVIINDATSTGKANRTNLENILPNFKDKVDFTFYEDMSMTEIQQRVSELNKNTIVYLLSFNRDKSNNIFSYEESTELISSKSNVPVYGVWDFTLDHGIVGGFLGNGVTQGTMAAQIGLRILNGENISNIPVIMENSNKYMFDYKQLKKYNISLNTLPKGSILINKPEIFNFTRSTLILIFILIFVIIIILFIVNSKNIKKIKTDKKTIQELEKTASTDFLNGISNRVAGFKALNELVSLSNVHKIKFSLCFIDLNNLKLVNDNFGHNEGDNYIKITVSIIQKHLLENQTIFRLGGDEFIILFPKSNCIEANEILNNINKYLEKYNADVNNKRNYEVSISYGISEYNPEIPITAEELVNIADKAMYLYKRKYKMQRSN